MLEAVVKWYSVAKGYGFVEPEGESDGDDIFVHHSLIDEQAHGPLLPGERVRVDAVHGERGWQAQSLVRLWESG